jgi:aminoglycoside phosphotransferase (APT) family kinase protein
VADGTGPLCHHDLGPWNFVVDSTGGLGVIDWDGAGPGDRMAELAYCVAGFAPLKRDSVCAELGWRSLPPRAERIELFCASYGLTATERPELADAIVASAKSGAEFGEAMHAEGKEPWASAWAADQGAGDREDLAIAEAAVVEWRRSW